ncbi:MAG: FtsB family cell division protein [bacterium]|jgi:cell division protein FtsB
MKVHRNRLLQSQPAQRTGGVNHSVRQEDRILYVRGLFAPPKSPEEKHYRKKQEAEEWRQFYSVGMLLTFGVIVGLISLFGDFGLLSYNQLQDRHQSLQLEIQELQQQRALLKQEIVALQESPAYLEMMARQELGLVGKDDFIYVIRPQEADSGRP